MNYVVIHSIVVSVLQSLTPTKMTGSNVPHVLIKILTFGASESIIISQEMYCSIKMLYHLNINIQQTIRKPIRALH